MTTDLDQAQTIFQKRMSLMNEGKASLVSGGNGRPALLFTSRGARAIERLRWKISEQRRRFIDNVLLPLTKRLVEACPASSEIVGMEGWHDGVATYHAEGNALTFRWEDKGPRKPEIVIPYMLAWRRISLLNSRLCFWDQILSWKMFPNHGIEYGGPEGITRYIVNGRTYLAKRSKIGWSEEKQKDILSYSKFSYPGMDEGEVFQTVTL